MVMDATSGGVAGKLAAWGGVAAAVVVLLGGVVSMARQQAEINEQLDRNCRIIVQLDQDLRLHILIDQANDPRAERELHGPTGLEAFPEASC